MEYLIAFGIIIFITAIVAFYWIKGIDYMQKNHPNYKADDFLNWEDDTHQRAAAGRDGWDEEWFPNETL